MFRAGSVIVIRVSASQIVCFAARWGRSDLAGSSASGRPVKTSLPIVHQGPKSVALRNRGRIDVERPLLTFSTEVLPIRSRPNIFIASAFPNIRRDSGEATSERRQIECSALLSTNVDAPAVGRRGIILGCMGPTKQPKRPSIAWRSRFIGTSYVPAPSSIVRRRRAFHPSRKVNPSSSNR